MDVEKAPTPRSVFVVYTGDLEWNARIQAAFEDEVMARDVADQLVGGEVEEVDFWPAGAQVPVHVEYSYVLDVADRSADHAYARNYLGVVREPTCVRGTDRLGAVTTLWGKASTPEQAKAMAQAALVEVLASGCGTSAGDGAAGE